MWPSLVHLPKVVCMLLNAVRKNTHIFANFLHKNMREAYKILRCNASKALLCLKIALLSQKLHILSPFSVILIFLNISIRCGPAWSIFLKLSVCYLMQWGKTNRFFVNFRFLYFQVIFWVKYLKFIVWK